MGIKEQVSAEEWKLLVNAMSAATSYVSMASGSGLESFKEVFSASKFAQKLSGQAGGSGYGEIVDELLGTLRGMSMKDAKEYTIKYTSKDLTGIREELKKVVADAGTIASKFPGADGFKQWVLDTAREVGLTKTGGFLGIGGKSEIDEQELQALEDLKALLGK